MRVDDKCKDATKQIHIELSLEDAKRLRWLTYRNLSIPTGITLMYPNVDGDKVKAFLNSLNEAFRMSRAVEGCGDPFAKVG